MINKFKQLNWRQKRDLKAKLKMIYENIVFQVAVAGGFLYLALWIWEQI